MHQTLFQAKLTNFVTKTASSTTPCMPYYPATNNQAEQMVCKTKKALLKLTEGTVQWKMARFLFWQHMTVSSFSGKTPAEAMFSQWITIPLDLMKLWPTNKDREFPRNGVTVDYSIGQPIYVRNFSKRLAWLPMVNVKLMGIHSFQTKSMTEDFSVDIWTAFAVDKRKEELQTWKRKRLPS